MKLQEVPGQSRETAGPWEDWLKDPEHKQCSPPSFQLQGIMREKQKEPGDQYLVPSLVSLEEFGVVGSWVSQQVPRPAGDRWGTPVSEGERDPCTGVSRAH